MNETLATAAPRLSLQADTAADLMRTDPVSVPADAPVEEVVRLFADRGISAAPVIDPAGRPVGVVSQSDIIAHQRERGRAGDGTAARVRDIMTPALFSVTPETAAAQVIEQLRAMNVNHLFVVDRGGVLLGVIGTRDILERLRP
jgi:CBS domain-containing protein